MGRVIWIVLDSVGCGDLPDCEEYGDKGCNTIRHTWLKNNGLNIPNLIKLGLGNIDTLDCIPEEKNSLGCYGKAAEISKGKDTTTGHWEMIGIYGERPFPTFPNGFPDSLINKFIEKCDLPGLLGNCVASGTEIIKELGEEHERTKKPIIYTSADSVFQIACNEEIYSPDELYRMCQIARELLQGDYAVGRVIARPYVLNGTQRERTSNRRDFSLKPPENNLLNHLKIDGYDVAAVGKIEDIFAGSGITQAVHTKDNMDGMEKTLDFMKQTDEGLIFTNLVEFDSKWGHRRDVTGYGKGLEEADKKIGMVMKNMRYDDILIINADHGCDPTAKGTDHTREFIPVLVYGKRLQQGVNLGTLETFADIGATVSEYFGTKPLQIGKSFLGKIV